MLRNIGLMNTLSQKQQTKNIKKQVKKLKNARQSQLHRTHRDNRKLTPWDMLDYISTDFVFNLFYMMIYKRFIRYFGIDYHRIYDLLHKLNKINAPIKNKDIKEKINLLFDGIETEEEVLEAFQSFRYDVKETDNSLIISNSDTDDDCNPLYPEPQEEHILPRYMLKNFLLFRKAFTDCAMGKIHNDLEFWIYACHYLLMDNKDFNHFGYGPDGKNFPYKKE